MRNPRRFRTFAGSSHRDATMNGGEASMEHRESSVRDARRAWESRAESIESITTCRCGHTLKEHAADGCTARDCLCEEIRDNAVQAEVEALDEL